MTLSLFFQVGLLSESLVGRFVTVPAGTGSGSLFLDRRCGAHTCHGHCTCAPHGQLTCDQYEECQDVTGSGIVIHYWPSSF